MEQKSLHEHFLNNDYHGFEEDISTFLMDNNNPPESHQRALLDYDL